VSHYESKRSCNARKLVTRPRVGGRYRYKGYSDCNQEEEIFTQPSKYFFIPDVAIQLLFLSIYRLLLYENLRVKPGYYWNPKLWVANIAEL